MANAFERLYRIRDASEVLGVPEATLRWWRHAGTGPKSAKVGGRVVYREADLHAWLEEQFAAADGER